MHDQRMRLWGATASGVVLWLLASPALAAEADPLSELTALPDLSTAATTLACFLLLLAGLAVLLVLGVRWLGARAGRGRPCGAGGRIEVLESRRLDARRQVYLLRVGTAVVVVASGDGAMTSLALPPETLPAAIVETRPGSTSRPIATSFLNILRRTPLARGA